MDVGSDCLSLLERDVLVYKLNAVKLRGIELKTLNPLNAFVRIN